MGNDTEMQDTKNNNAALIEFAERVTGSELREITHPDTGKTIPVIELPKGRALHGLKELLDQYADHPDRMKGTATLTTLASFIEHANRQKLAESVIFADDVSAQPSLTAVYDYHEAEPGPEGGELGLANFLQHRAVYSFPFSDEWKAWTALSGKAMEMVDFAEFVEDRLVDVILPEEGQDSIKTFAARLELTLATPRQLMELSRGLKVNVDLRVERAHSLKSGASKLVFSEEHKTDGVTVPGGFALSIPVFRGGAKFDVPVLLRYRIDKGNVTWTYVLYRTDLILRTVIKDAADRAHAETGLPVFFGKSE
jgi:uncharacterized protein YfdQ (DUF2303 family)